MTTPRGLATFSLRGAAVAFVLFAGASAQAQAAGDEGEGGLRAQLLDFGTAHAVRMIGLDVIEDEPARAIVGGGLTDQLDHLLSGYNYLLVPDGKGSAAVLRILGRGSEELDAPPKPVSVTTVRSGPHHLVSTVLTGRNGFRAELMMMLDTGATTIVLPDTLAARLGFTPDQLKPGVARTAGGDVALRLGRLSEVRVGTARAADVPVAFIDDRQIGAYGLLGMSFLERFQMTIEDAGSRLTLEAK